VLFRSGAAAVVNSTALYGAAFIWIGGWIKCSSLKRRGDA
jgi:hypothetical protein